MRVAHFIQELLADALDGDTAPGSLVFGDDEGTVSASLDDRIADVGEVWNRTPVVQAIAAGTLRAALDDVARDDSRGEAIPVIVGPAVRITQGCHGQRGVR